MLAAMVAVGIFVLTEQAPHATARTSKMVNDFLVDLFGRTSALYDPATDTWLGMDIRHWAHAAEFWMFGVSATLATWLAVKPKLAKAGGISLAACVALSLFDQCHKLFVPGRHFDALDLAMDALGYGVAIVTVLLVAKGCNPLSYGKAQLRGADKSAPDSFTPHN